MLPTPAGHRAAALRARSFAEARCVGPGIDPDWWFPSDPGQAATAIRICRTCPHLIPCAAYAIANAEPDGVWGGTTPAQREGRPSSAGYGQVRP